MEIRLRYDLLVLLLLGRVDGTSDGILLQNTGKVYGIRSTVEEQLGMKARVLSVEFDRGYILWFLQPAPESGCLHPAEEDWRS